MQTLLCVDPSTRTLGWAVFRIGDGASFIKAGVIHKGVDEDALNEAWPTIEWIDRIDRMVSAVRLVAIEHRCTAAAIELPQVFQSAAGQGASASGSIIKLVAAAFSIRSDLYAIERMETVLMVPVNRWKGTVPKEITQMRIRRAWDWKGSDHNEADAVGIGDWYIRKYLKLARC